MATSSITKDFYFESEKSVDKLLTALEKAEEQNRSSDVRDKESVYLSREDFRKLFAKA